MNVGKRLLRYVAIYKKTVILALFMLAIAVSAELAGPWIAKDLIDRNVMGIELPWYEAADGEFTVVYNGHLYKRSDHFASNEVRGQESRVLQSGRQFYYINGGIRFDGVREFHQGELTVTKGGETAIYPAVPLTGAELKAFYSPELANMVYWIIVYFILLLIASGFNYGEKYLLQTSANRIIQKLRLDVYGQIQRLPIAYFENLPAGKIVSRVTNDTEAVRELFVSVLANFVSSCIYMTGILIALFFLDGSLALLCLTIVPLLALWVRIYRRYSTRYNQMIRSRLSDMNGMINETIQGMPILRAFRRQQQTEQEFGQLNEDYFTFQNKQLNLNAITSHNLVGVLRNAAFAALLWYFGGASLGTGGAVSLGVLYAFVDYLNRLFQPVTNIVNQLAQLEQSLVSAGRVFELLDEEGVDVDESPELARYTGHIVFDKVSFAYKEETVLKQVSFQAKPGETVALVGHTGSGKSTIMNLLFRFYDAGEGSITIDGRNIRDLSRQQLRKYMGIVLQDPFLFTGSIATNVSLHDPAIGREKVECALREVGADQLLKHLPQGFDEPVLEKGSTLSAGQRQLISFARALAFDPAILILDEATASIDTETEVVIQDALNVLKRGRTTLIIAHRLSTIRHADQILVLHHGEIVERGSHEQLMRRNGRYYQMYQLQQGKVEAEVS